MVTEASFSGNDTPVIAQREINSALKRYVAMLVKQHPFVKDLKLDSRLVSSQLATFWPVDPAWAAEAKELWAIINAVIHSIPARTPTYTVRLRIAVADSALTPVAFPESGETAAVATLDASEGVLRSCVLRVMDEPPPLTALTIPAGIMIICQPVGELPDPYIDYRHELGMESSDQLFAERHQDKELKANDPPPIPYSKPDLIREVGEKLQKHSQEWELLMQKQQEEKLQFEQAGAEVDGTENLALIAATADIEKVPLHHHVYRFLGLQPEKTSETNDSKPEQKPTRSQRFLKFLRPDPHPNDYGDT